MDDRVQAGGLSVAGSLHRFITEEALPGSGVQPEAFWAGADAIIHDLAPRNRELLRRRDELQTQIDEYHRANPGVPDPEPYTAFLTEIGYLLDEPEDFEVSTDHVDDEVARIAGPAAGRPAAERPLRHQRLERPLGLAVRRALRLRRDLPRGRPRPGRLLQPGPRRRGDLAGRGPSSTSTSRSRAARTPTPRRTRWTARDSPSRSRRTWCGWPTRPSSSGPAGTRPPPRRSCWCTTACTSRSSSTGTTRSARPTPPA